MHQANLFAAPALLTGVVVDYSLDPLDAWGGHHLTVTPQWSKDPSGRRGIWSQTFDADEVEVLPDLLAVVVRTLQAPDVGTFMPRNLQRKYDEYQRYYDQHHTA